MNISLSSVTLLIAALLMSSAPVPAQDQAPGQAGNQGERQRLLQRFDTNGDGQLDETERQAAQQARQKMITKFDANGDGQLDDGERQVARQARQQRRQRMLQHFDTDGDGQLNDAERQQARQMRQQRGRGEGGPPNRGGGQQ